MKRFAPMSLCLVAGMFACGLAAAQSINTIRGADDVSGAPAPGADLIRHWIVAPDTTCADGTTPAAYVRRALNAANQNNWIVFLQAGGSCDDGQDCVDRWQSFQNNYGMQKLSTSIPIATWQAWWGAAAPPPNGWTAQGANYQVPTGIVGNGIFSNLAANPFANWNKVYLNYCSSDSWIGDYTDRPTNGIDNLGTGAIPAGTDTPYDISFHGSRIFDEMVDDLRAGLVYCRGAMCETMPDLDNANMVLLAGSSAGSNGVKHNLDLFRAGQNAINPVTQVRGVLDAAGNPSSYALPWPVPPAPLTSAQQRFDYQWNDVYVGFWNARVDDSCLLLNVGVESRCADTTHVLRHHLTTPFFHRMDLQDSLAMDNYTGIFFPSPPYLPNIAPLNLAQGVADQLREIREFSTRLLPRYPIELATVTADAQWLSPGVLGPRCTDHVALTSNRGFLAQELPTPAGPINYADALFAWVNTAPGGIAGPLRPSLIETVGVGPVGFAQCN